MKPENKKKLISKYMSELGKKSVKKRNITKGEASAMAKKRWAIFYAKKKLSTGEVLPPTNG